MYKRDVNLSLEDILESIEKIENYTNEISLDEFASNKRGRRN